MLISCELKHKFVLLATGEQQYKLLKLNLACVYVP
jgi:hypothetical protein